MDDQTELYELEEEVMRAFLDSLPDDYFEDLSSLLHERGLEVPASKEGMLRLLAAECEECLPRHPEYLNDETYRLGLDFFSGLDRSSILEGDE
jgi:hypothetical protein